MSRKYFFRFVGFLLIVLSQHDAYGFVFGNPSFGVFDLALIISGISLLVGIDNVNQYLVRSTPLRMMLVNYVPFLGILSILLGLFFLKHHFSVYLLPFLVVTLFISFIVLYKLSPLGQCFRKIVAFCVVCLFFVFDAHYLSSGFAVFFIVLHSFFFLKKKPKLRANLSGCWIYFIFVLAVLMRIPLVNENISTGYVAHLDFAMQIQDAYPHAPITSRSNIGVFFEYPPLSYYVLLAVYHFAPQDITLFLFGKMFIVLISSLSIFPLFLIFKDVLDLRTALFGAFIFAMFPIINDYDGGHISSFLAEFLFLMALLGIVKGNRSKQTRYFVIAGVSAGLLLLTNVLGAIVLIFLIIAHIFFDYISTNKVQVSVLRHLIVFFVIALLIGLIWWGPIIQRHGSDFLRINKFRTDLSEAPDYCMKAYLPFQYIKKNVPTYPLLFLLSFIGLLSVRTRGSSSFFALWSTFLFFSLSSIFGIFFFTSGERYLLYTAPFLYLSAGAGLVFLFEHIPQAAKLFRIMACILFGVILLFSAHAYYSKMYNYPLKPLEDANLRASNWLEENTPQISVVVTNTWVAYRLPYLGKRAVLNGKEGSEFTEHDNQRDAALIFSGLINESTTISLLNKYNSQYVYLYNSSLRSFPSLGDDDCHGSMPAYLFWSFADTQKFDAFASFHRIYFDNSTNSQIIIYECQVCNN